MLDYSRFAVRLRRSDLPRMVEILRAIPPERVLALRSGLASVWERFTYSFIARAERWRQCGRNGLRRESEGCDAPGWRPSVKGGSRELGFAASPHLRGVDAIDTLMRVLAARLSNLSNERG